MKKALISFSAGPDSVYLLHDLQQKHPDTHFTLVYFDHGLRPEMTPYEREITKSYASPTIDVILKKIPVSAYASTYKCSEELAGRNLRYSWLHHIAKRRSITTVYTGHHKDDFIETVLMQLIKGAKDNLVGILPQTPLKADSSITLKRPLLEKTKEEILDYLTKNQITYSIDSSNDELHYTRNQIRHQVCPTLLEINPNLHQTLKDYTQYTKGYHDQHKETLENTMNTLHYSNSSLSIPIKAIQELSTPLQQTVLRQLVKTDQNKRLNSTRLITPHPYQISSAHIHAALTHIAHLEPTPKHIMLTTNFGFTITTEALSLGPFEQVEDTRFEHQLSVPGDLTIPEIKQKVTVEEVPKSSLSSYHSTEGQAYIDADKLHTSTLVIRTRKPGDTFTPYGMTQSKRLKKYLIDRKVSSDIKGRLPLFFAQNELIWVPGHQISEECKITPQTKKVLKLSLEDLRND